MPLDALAAAEARLESGQSARLAWEPESHREAVRAWVAARGLKRGGHHACNAALRQSFEAHARASGWALESMSPYALGLRLRELGFKHGRSAGRAGYMVDRDSARALRHLAPPRKRTTRRVTRKPRAARREAPPFWPLPHRAMPLADTLGRVWPTARVAAACLPRVPHQDIQRAATKLVGAGGVLWRYLTPEEVRCVPPTARAGDVLPALAWGGTVAVRCCTCGGAGLGGGQGTPTPPPPGFLTTPSMGPAAGDPPHMP